MGLKLIRAMPVDQKLVDGLIGVPKGGDARRTTLRKRLNIIAPKPEERGRSLLATNLPRGLQPRYLWSFFATYDVEDVRLLRKSCVACISFTTQREAERALRERANFSLHGQDIICLKMHE